MAGKMEVIEHVATESGLTRAAATKAVNTMLDAITDMLATSEEVRLSGLGTFRIRQTAEGQGRNPATRELMVIPAGKRIGFAAGSRLVTAVSIHTAAGTSGGSSSPKSRGTGTKQPGERRSPLR